MWLSKYFLKGPAETDMNAQVPLTNYANLYHDGALKSYSANFRFILRRWVTDDNIAKLDAKVHNLQNIVELRRICIGTMDKYAGLRYNVRWKIR